MIILTKHPNHLKQICALIPKIKDTGYKPKEFMVWLIKNNDQYLRIWVDIIDNEVKSFIVAQVVRPLIEDELFITLVYVDPKSNGVANEFLKRIEGWAMAMGIRKLSTYVKSRSRAFREKYGFKFEHVGLIKKLNY